MGQSRMVFRQEASRRKAVDLIELSFARLAVVHRHVALLLFELEPCKEVLQTHKLERDEVVGVETVDGSTDGFTAVFLPLNL